jgi:hypothetical protein
MRQIFHLGVASLVSIYIFAARIPAKYKLRVRNRHGKRARPFRPDKNLSVWDTALRSGFGKVFFDVILPRNL